MWIARPPSAEALRPHAGAHRYRAGRVRHLAAERGDLSTGRPWRTACRKLWAPEATRVLAESELWRYRPCPTCERAPHSPELLRHGPGQPAA